MRLAIDGGSPVRRLKLPIYRLEVQEEEIRAVETVLRTGQISRGAYPREFEDQLARYVGTPHAVVVSSGSSALHAGLLAFDLPAGSEVIVPSLTFAATFLAPFYVGSVPRFAEVDPVTWTLDPDDVRRHITPRTRAIITVDYAGQTSPMTALTEIARQTGCRLLVDAAHSLGASSGAGKVGNDGDLTTFSFFATKNVVAGEGGAVTTRDTEIYNRLQRIKAHGIQFPSGPRISGICDVVELGYNFHLSNLNIALASCQLKTLDRRVAERKRLASELTRLIQQSGALEWLQPPSAIRDHTFHLYTVRLRSERLRRSRDEVIHALAAEGIEAGLYYRPGHLFSYVRERLNTKPGMLPVTERICDELLTLPLYTGLTAADLEDISRALVKVLRSYAC